MNIAFIITTPDFAGTNVRDNLLEHYDFEKTDQEYAGHPVYKVQTSEHMITMYSTDTKCVHCEEIEGDIDAELYIFPTTHRSAAGTHSLSLHTQGNWDKAELGGKPRTVSYCPAIVMKELFKELTTQGEGMDMEITLEATHHGPVLEKPTIFTEIGSDESQWKRPELGKVWADVLMAVLSRPLPECVSAIGIGGPHYCHNLNKIPLRTDLALGHVIANYALPTIDKEMIEQAIEKTVPKATMAILDWKGLGKDKARILEILDEIGIEVRKSKEF